MKKNYSNPQVESVTLLAQMGTMQNASSNTINGSNSNDPAPSGPQAPSRGVTIE